MMLRFTESFGLGLRKKSPPFSRDGFKALLFALIFHIGFWQAVKIVSPPYCEPYNPLPPIAVEIDLHSEAPPSYSEVATIFSFLDSYDHITFFNPSLSASNISSSFSLKKMAPPESDFDVKEKLRYNPSWDQDEDW